MSKNTNISELINYLSYDGSGNIVFTTISAAATNTDKFLVSDAGVLKFRTAAQLLSDIGAQASGSYQAALSGTGFVKISGSTISYDNSTYATETYVGTAISNLVASSPATLDTLNELALALGSDPNFATTVATSIGTKQAQLNGTGFVKVTGTTISYDSSTYLTTTTAGTTYVPYTGGTANVNLGVYNLAGGNVNINGNGSGGGALRLKQYGSSEANLEGYNSISTLTSGVFYFTSSASVPNFKNFVLNPSGLTDNTVRTYDLPDASGTLALTSNLSSYLPLSGGTLTGPLAGTTSAWNGYAINATPPSVGTAQTFVRYINAGSDWYIGSESSVAGSFFGGASAYASVFFGTNPFQFITGGTKRFEIATGGVTSTVGFTGTSATLSSTLSVNTTNAVSVLEIGAVESDGTGSTNALRIQSKTGASNQQLLIGVNQTGTYSFVQSSQASVGYKPLSLNPNGGNVGIGTTTIDQILQVAGNISLGRYNVATSRWIGITNGGGGFGDSSGSNIEFTSPSGTSNGINFYTYNGTTYSAKLTIASTGAATFSSTISAGGGINTNGSITSTVSGTSELRLQGGGYGGTYNTSLRSMGGAIGILQFGNNGDNYVLIGNTNTSANTFLSFRVNCTTEATSSGTEAFRITSSGVGNSSTTFNGTSTFLSNILIGTTNSDIGGSVAGTIIRQNGTMAICLNDTSPANYQSPIAADRRNTAGDGLMYGMWRQGIFQAGIGATSGQDMYFYTGDGGNSSQPIRMTIKRAGDVGIGITSPLQTAANRTVLTINGTSSNVLNFGVGGTLSAYIYNDTATTGIYAQGNLYLQADGANFTSFVNNGLERMRISNVGSVFYKGYVGGTLLGGFSVIGTLSAYNTGDRYLHVKINTIGSMMFWIKIFGYVYTAAIVEGMCGGYIGGGTGGVNQAFQNGNIVTQYQNNGFLEVVVDTLNAATTNRWGSITFLGGTDTIVTVQPLEIMAYSWTASTTRVY